MIRIYGATLLCLIGALSANLAEAGPIPASPSPVPSAGESLLTSSFVANNSVNIDWEVISTTGTAFAQGLYAYLYQVENTSTSAVDIFSVSIPTGAAGTIVGVGVLGGDNLDTLSGFHPAHVVANFPILLTEQDPFTPQALTGVNANINPTDDTVTWSFDPLAVGKQSETLYFLSTMPPTYGNASLQDRIPPSPWTSLGPGGQPVPVPVPEPSTTLLMLLGIVTLGAWRKARR